MFVAIMPHRFVLGQWLAVGSDSFIIGKANNLSRNRRRASIKVIARKVPGSNSCFCHPEQKELGTMRLFQNADSPVIPYSWDSCNAYLSMKCALGTNQGENKRS